MSDAYADMKIEELREKLEKLRGAVKDYSEKRRYGSCNLFGHYLWNTIMCKNCELQTVCKTYKETD